MNIAIIGAGNVGQALATSLNRNGHSVTLAARDAAKTTATAADLGVQAAASATEAATGAEIVILAVPADALEALAGELGDAVSGKVVVDVTNRMNPDHAARSNAEGLQDRLGKSPVVKAFNTAFASRQADPAAGGVAADGYVAGDDETAKQRVLELVESIGFRPVDAGPLAASRMLEGMAWLNISRNMQGGSWQSAWVILEPRQQAASR